MVIRRNMKITFDAKELIAASEWVIKVAPNGAILMKVLENSTVIFRAEGNAGMRSITLNAHIDDMDGKNSYDFSAPHLDKMISALIKKHADGEVSFEFRPHAEEAMVSYGTLKFPVALLFGSGVLPSDSEIFSPIGTADYGDLMECLRSANKLTGKQQNAESMIDLTFDAADSTISIMGTDKVVLGVFYLSFTPDDEYKSGKPSRFLVIPDLNNLKTDADIVSISESPESMKLDFGGGKIATIRKQEASMFPWGRLLKNVKSKSAREDEASIMVNVRDVITSSDIAISLISQAGSSIGRKIIVMKVCDGKIAIRSEEDNSPVDSISTDYRGDEKTIRFNYDELKTALSALSSENVYLKYANDDVPVIVEQISQDGDIDNSVFMLINTPMNNHKKPR